MKLSDLYRKGATYNWQKPQGAERDFTGRKSPRDKAPTSSIVYAQHDNGVADLEDGQAEDGRMDPLSFRKDASEDDYSEIHDESETGTAVALNIMPELRIVKHRRQDPAHTETPRRSRQKQRGKHGMGLPNRSGNQTTPPTKIRHRKFMGIPDNLGPGV